MVSLIDVCALNKVNRLTIIKNCILTRFFIMYIKIYYKTPLNPPLKLHSGVSKNTVTMYIGASYYVHCKEVVPSSEIDKYYHYWCIKVYFVKCSTVMAIKWNYYTCVL